MQRQWSIQCYVYVSPLFLPFYFRLTEFYLLYPYYIMVIVNAIIIDIMKQTLAIQQQEIKQNII